MNETFGKKKLIRDISANTLQTATSQFFGLLIFYLLSKYLPKDDFGEFNWSIAIGFTLIAVCSLGLDLVFVKRVAAAKDVLVISGIHFFHTVIVGVILTASVLLLPFIFPSFTTNHPLFFGVIVYISVFNVANSFKLCLNGLDAYNYMAIIVLSSNVLKLLLIIYFYMTARFTAQNIVLSYLAGALVEFVTGYLLMNKSIRARIKPVLKVTEYKYFILESLPQLGVVIFDSALSRVDLILLGLLSTSAITADYSFVYKVYELSKLPLIIISPLLLTRFSRMFANNNVITENQKTEISFFFRLELILIMFIPIFLVSVWTPVIDYFTNGKYGAVNEVNYGILSLCVPLVCIINFLWTVGFVRGQLKTILYITMVVSVLNIVANYFLIPLYGSLGSALAFLGCTLFQLFLYIKFIHLAEINPGYRNILVIFLSAIAATIIAKLLSNNIIFTTIISLTTYIFLVLLTGQMSVEKLKNLVRKD